MVSTTKINQPDRVVMSFIAGVILLALIDLSQIASSVRFTIDALIGMAPF